MAIFRFLLVVFSSTLIGLSYSPVLVAGYRKSLNDKEDFDQVCKQFQEKNNEEASRVEEFKKKFPQIDRIFSPEDLQNALKNPNHYRTKYKAALMSAQTVVDACCKSLEFLAYSYQYARLYDDLIAQSTFKSDSQYAFVSLHGGILSPDMDGVAGFLKIDTNDADLVAVNYRMAHFIKHLDAALLNPDRHPHYVFSYDPKQDESFLKSIITNNAVSEEARQAAQRFLAQGKLYLLQKNSMERTHEYHRSEMAIAEMLKKSSNPLFVDIVRDRNSLEKIVTRVCQSKNSDFRAYLKTN